MHVIQNVAIVYMCDDSAWFSVGPTTKPRHWAARLSQSSFLMAELCIMYFLKYSQGFPLITNLTTPTPLILTEISLIEVRSRPKHPTRWLATTSWSGMGRQKGLRSLAGDATPTTRSAISAFKSKSSTNASKSQPTAPNQQTPLKTATVRLLLVLGELQQRPMRHSRFTRRPRSIALGKLDQSMTRPHTLSQLHRIQDLDCAKGPRRLCGRGSSFTTRLGKGASLFLARWSLMLATTSSTRGLT